jgi:hypothetical protein
LRILATVAVLPVLCIFFVSAWTQERKIQRSDLPTAVQETVAVQASGARILGFSEETENGQTFYEAELMTNGRRRDVLMDSKGSIVEVEQEIPIGSLPATVKHGLQFKAGKGGKLLKVESLTKRGKLVAYEAKVFRAGTRSEVQVGPNGEPLARE